MIKGQKDVFTGLLFIAVGLFFYITGSHLEYGTPADMGAGFLPLTISVLLIAIGAIQLVRGLRTPGKAVAFKFKQPATIVASIVAFGFLLEKIGAIISILILMLVPALLHKKFSLKNFCLSYLAVVALLLIFKFGLKSTILL